MQLDINLLCKSYTAHVVIYIHEILLTEDKNEIIVYIYNIINMVGIGDFAARDISIELIKVLMANIKIRKAIYRQLTPRVKKMIPSNN